MQDAPKAVWSIPYVFVAFFPSLKQNFTLTVSSAEDTVNVFLSPADKSTAGCPCSRTGKNRNADFQSKQTLPIVSLTQSSLLVLNIFHIFHLLHMQRNFRLSNFY